MTEWVVPIGIGAFYAATIFGVSTWHARRCGYDWWERQTPMYVGLAALVVYLGCSKAVGPWWAFALAPSIAVGSVLVGIGVAVVLEVAARYRVLQRERRG